MCLDQLSKGKVKRRGCKQKKYNIKHCAGWRAQNRVVGQADLPSERYLSGEIRGDEKGAHSIMGAPPVAWGYGYLIQFKLQEQLKGFEV